MYVTLGFKCDSTAMRNVLAMARRREKPVLNQIGGYIAKTGKNSMRQGKRGQKSRPGTPPLAWTKRYKGAVRYAHDAARHSVVIGAISFDGRPVPGFIEHGGMQMVTERRTGKRKVGRYRPRPAMRLALEAAMEKAVAQVLKNYIHK